MTFLPQHEGLEGADILQNSTHSDKIPSARSLTSSAMRLLDTNKLEVVLIREDAIPPYAILSHTWGASEVSLQDMNSFRAKTRQRNSHGFKKITGAAKLAASHGYQWIWIDTC